MALTLDPILQTAQDGQSHHPIVKILSSEWGNDIPFDGQILNETSLNETKPKTIIHSSSRLCLAYIIGTEDIKYVYTDVARTEFNSVQFALGNTINDLSLTELTDGNIGIVYRYGTSNVMYKIISVIGVEISSGSVFTDADIISGPFVITLANDTYLMVYVKKVGDDYKFYKRTSSNFTAWSAESEITVGGLTSTKRKANLSLAQISTGDIFLWFDYVDVFTDPHEVINIYYSISPDGTTWGNAVKVTNYSDFTSQAINPSAKQKEANSLHLAFTEQSAALHMTQGELNWCCGRRISHIHIAEATGKCYLTICGDGGTPGVIQIDIATWTIDNCWNCSTAPGFHQHFCDSPAAYGIEWLYQGDGIYCVMANGNFSSLAVLNSQTNTIKYYHILSHDGFTKNIDWTPKWTAAGYMGIQCCRIDASTNKMWLVIDTHRSTHPFAEDFEWQVGYIDLTEEIEPEGLYTWNLISKNSGADHWPGWTQIYYEYDYVMCLYANAFSDQQGIILYNLTTGGMVKNYWQGALYPEFPYKAIGQFVFDGTSRVYCVYGYDSSHGCVDKRGMMIIDILADTFEWDRPTWATLDDYSLCRICLAGDALWITTRAEGSGVTKYDLNTRVWTLYNNDNYPGLNPYTFSQSFGLIVYDSSRDLIFTEAFMDWVGHVSTLTCFSQHGYMRRSYYSVGTYTTSWSFATPALLIQGVNDRDAVIVFEPTAAQAMLACWVSKLVTEESLKWDREGGDFPISDYLIRGEEVSYEKTIDGMPNRLEFVVSCGHLFDPYNLNSLLAPFLKKGRKLALQAGEKISGANYWQNLGMFVVQRTSLHYRRGEYPVMKVEAEDKRGIWDQMNVIVTDAYATYPEEVIKDVVTEWSDMELAEIDLPVFDNRIEIWMQWIDTSLAGIVTQICNRFGYYPRVNKDGKLTARKISDSNPVDHTYLDIAKIIDFSPDDDFSDYVNQITIVGQERDWMDVMYGEERVGNLNGTCGWWGYKNDFQVYYSEDRQRQCRLPRLQILESSTSIGFKLSGELSESITYVDLEDKYCIVTVKAPDLIPLLIAGLATLVASYFSPDLIIAPPGGGLCFHSRIGTFLTALGSSICLMVLGAIGNFQYEIWAKPVGQCRRTIQYTKDDVEFQSQINMIVPKRYEDPMCYTVEQCKLVAEFEMMITSLQRKRIKFQKIAHLQDEEGDTIQIPHPYTGAAMKIFITDLRRKMKIPDSPGGDGYWIDEIEGWKL